jgi:trans-aconitate methyltransferase
MQLTDVVRNYDWAAPRYHRWADLVCQHVLRVEKYRQKTLDLLGLPERATALDIGCGTGRNFPILVPRVGAAGRVIGLECSKGILAQARKRVEGPLFLRAGMRDVNSAVPPRPTSASKKGAPDRQRRPSVASCYTVRNRRFR